MANGWCVIDKGKQSCTMAGLRKALWEGPLPVVGTGAVSGPASPDHACAAVIPVAKSNRSAATPKGTAPRNVAGWPGAISVAWLCSDRGTTPG